MSKHDSDAAAMSDLSEQLAVALERAVDKLSDIPDKRFFPAGIHEIAVKASTAVPSIELRISAVPKPTRPPGRYHLFSLVRPMWFYPGNSGP